ncbi:unnamed protein product [Vitrella brassicaformis CCMP3155]|uniref:Thiaminase-2/PQQC domain-containing protein n=2 Tax=Vitrella brassicaformis TaxID=1169539 RepID=A0A0G4ELZ0_VITBC|nr:unnamed protein product [Vitrella brassicaformis CCMP3155]|eukprot:CEL98439.1 unnamed protein product [Vitrella brassicaformis CCMP3155]
MTVPPQVRHSATPALFAIAAKPPVNGSEDRRTCHRPLPRRRLRCSSASTDLPLTDGNPLEGLPEFKFPSTKTSKTPTMEPPKEQDRPTDKQPKTEETISEDESRSSCVAEQGEDLGRSLVQGMGEGEAEVGEDAEPANDVLRVKFGSAVWQSVSGTYQRLADHPFCLDMAEGNLPAEVFQRFVVQCLVLLDDVQKGTSVLAQRTPEGLQEMLMEVASVSRQVSDDLSSQYPQQRELLELGSVRFPCQLDSCFYLSNFIRSTCGTRVLPAGLACIIAFWWILRDMLKEIDVVASQDNPYRPALQAVCSSYTLHTVESLRFLLDAIGESTGDTGRTEIERVFQAMSGLLLNMVEELYPSPPPPPMPGFEQAG